MKYPNQTQNDPASGFTIIELVVSIIVFALLVPAVASFLNLLNTLNDQAADTAIVNALAENKVESLRSAKFNSLSNGTVSFVAELPETISTPRTATYTVTSPSTGLKEINLNVTYNDHGSARTLTYKTYVGELGVGQY